MQPPQPPLLRLARAIDRLSAALGDGVKWLVLAMVLVGGFNAVARYAGRWGGVSLASNGWIEAQWYLFGLVVLFAAPDALRRGAHVRVDVVYGRLSEAAKRRVDAAGAVLLLLPFCVFAAVACVPMVRASLEVWETSPDPGGLPRWPLKAMLPVAFALLGVQGVAELIRAVHPPPDDEASA